MRHPATSQAKLRRRSPGTAESPLSTAPRRPPVHGRMTEAWGSPVRTPGLLDSRAIRARSTPTAREEWTACACALPTSFRRHRFPRPIPAKTAGSRGKTARPPGFIRGRFARTTNASRTPTAGRASRVTVGIPTSTASRTFASGQATAPSTRTARPPASARRAACPVSRRTLGFSATHRVIHASTTRIARSLVRTAASASSPQRSGSGTALRCRYAPDRVGMSSASTLRLVLSLLPTPAHPRGTAVVGQPCSRRDRSPSRVLTVWFSDRRRSVHVDAT